VSGTVVRLMSSYQQGGSVSFLLERPPNLPHAGESVALECSPTDPVFVKIDELGGGLGEVPAPGIPAAAVMAAGSKLLDSLSIHPAVQQAIQAALAIQDERAPIYLRVGSGGVIESLPWESLHHGEKGFLALDERWPIARLVNDSIGMKERVFDPPLRILGVLTALGVEAKPEFERLYTALQKAPVESQLSLFVCEEQLKNDIDALSDQRVRVAYLTSKEDFFSESMGFKPHLLHFFCHGHAMQGSPHLELATRAAWETGQSNAISLETGELRRMKEGAWVLVLNCCEGSKDAEGSSSLAYSLVSEGFPAVVAMRRAIAVPDANIFCESFYQAVFAELERLKRNDEIDIEWARVMHAPRTALRDKYPLPPTQAAAAFAEWTLPVLYVRSESLRRRKLTALAPEGNLREDQIAYLRAMLEKLVEAQDGLHPGTPKEVRDKIDEKVSGVTAALYGRQDSPGG